MKTTRFEKAQEGKGEKRNEADGRRHRRDGAVCTQECRSQEGPSRPLCPTLAQGRESETEFSLKVTLQLAGAPHLYIPHKVSYSPLSKTLPVFIAPLEKGK